MPAVSVILLYHCDTEYLRPALASILGQTFRDFEVLLVDNGVGLDAPALGIPASETRVRWIRFPKNVGISAGHNAAVAQAAGEFIALMDSDDLAMPERFARQVQALREHPDAGLVTTLAARIDAESRLVGQIEFTLPRPVDQLAYSLIAGVLVTPASMVRRELAHQIPYPLDLPLAADLEFQARMAECTRFLVIPEVLFRYRVHASQSTQASHAAVQRGRCLVQIRTARRRAGRVPTEEMPPAELTPAAVWRWGSRLCLREGFFVLAAYQARRGFAIERSPAAAVGAGWLFLRILARAPASQIGGLVRMFLLGPVRAFRIQDLGGPPRS